MAKFIRIACEVPAEAVGDVLIYLSQKGYQNLGVAVEGAEAAGALRQLGARKNAARRDGEEESQTTHQRGKKKKGRYKPKSPEEFRIRADASPATKYYTPKFPDLRQKMLDYINDHPDTMIHTDQLSGLPQFKKYTHHSVRANLYALALRGDIERMPGIDPKHILYQAKRKEMGVANGE
jgi:hypothetical protein